MGIEFLAAVDAHRCNSFGLNLWTFKCQACKKYRVQGRVMIAAMKNMQTALGFLPQDTLECPKCGKPMRIPLFFDDEASAHIFLTTFWAGCDKHFEIEYLPIDRVLETLVWPENPPKASKLLEKMGPKPPKSQ
jgi:hypothetical protein